MLTNIFFVLQFPGQLAVLAFPSNQFGHQENSDGVEILNALQNVRPGDGFVPKAEMFDKVNCVLLYDGFHTVIFRLR